MAYVLMFSSAQIVASARIETTREFKIEAIGCPFGQAAAKEKLAWQQDRIRSRVAEMKNPSNDEIARLIFDCIDSDQNGTITFRELAWTLGTTGVPASDCSLIMERFDDDHSYRLEFDEFRLHMQPLCTWAFQNLRAGIGREGARRRRDNDIKSAILTHEKTFRLNKRVSD